MQRGIERGHDERETAAELYPAHVASHGAHQPPYRGRFAGEALAKVAQHRARMIDSHYVHAMPRHRNGDSTVANPVFQDGAARVAGQGSVEGYVGRSLCVRRRVVRRVLVVGEGPGLELLIARRAR